MVKFSTQTFIKHAFLLLLTNTLSKKYIQGLHWPFAAHSCGDPKKKKNLGQIMKLQDPSNQRALTKPSAKSSHKKVPLDTRHFL